MSDARALLRAKRQEARINHPLAAYTSSGQLRCIACDMNVKHASAWEGHIGSKSHRTNAARLREERARAAQREEEERESLKRKAMEVDEADEDAEDEDAYMSGSDAKKRRVESEVPSAAPTAALATAGKTKRAAIPADFFSDPSMAPPPVEEEDEEEEEGAVGPAGAPAAPADALDLEWQQFQQSVVNAPDYQETYERATVVAEPVLAAEVPQGFPSSTVGGIAEEPEKEEELDEEAKRRKKEQEERELIMDRLMEEEQAQEEADERVSVLKNKLEALKKKREAARAAKKGKP
ncbi:hypothetical protein BD310DRAFT_909722 [Dichomitus squalens]|uniref:Zinc finger double-stranded RNA binding domain-containing protein n=1 Tax=Dichomitus squalens TaxID=114155 RepID=A0A4Q9PDX4_9APHY|nr:hypothetical protein BD310DRAFT_909722 [Dichomitus squalens]